jgi:hypothetical protein
MPPSHCIGSKISPTIGEKRANRGFGGSNTRPANRLVAGVDVVRIEERGTHRRTVEHHLERRIPGCGEGARVLP